MKYVGFENLVIKLISFEKMTEEKCYSLEKDGTYCLGFPNRYALSEKEIEEIFSEYGSVISVRASGDERGFRFVRFRTLEEAEKAINDLKGNKKIRILPKKPKAHNNNDKGSSKENQKNGNSSGKCLIKRTKSLIFILIKFVFLVNNSKDI